MTARRALEDQLSLGDRSSPVAEQTVVDASSRDRLGELDSLLRQIDASDGPDSGLGVRELTGTRTALWTVVYDAACAASEQLADELNEYWRGAVTAEDTRTRIADLAARFELLESLGPPPGE
ncbi:MAG TPA: hypothetical protein VEX36_05830 [Thermoleophilaceae bacterium]|nr:hypothetical protein [Thermoleophilaceae bacterium]